MGPVVSVGSLNSLTATYEIREKSYLKDISEWSFFHNDPLPGKKADPFSLRGSRFSCWKPSNVSRPLFHIFPSQLVWVAGICRGILWSSRKSNWTHPRQRRLRLQRFRSPWIGKRSYIRQGDPSGKLDNLCRTLLFEDFAADLPDSSSAQLVAAWRTIFVKFKK